MITNRFFLFIFSTNRTIVSYSEGEKANPYNTENFEEIYGGSIYSNYEFGVKIWRGVVFYMFRVLPPISKKDILLLSYSPIPFMHPLLFANVT